MKEMRKAIENDRFKAFQEQFYAKREITG